MMRNSRMRRSDGIGIAVPSGSLMRIQVCLQKALLSSNNPRGQDVLS